MSYLQVLRPTHVGHDNFPLLTVLLQKERVSDETSHWVATCCELGLVGRAGTTEEAKEALYSEVVEFFANASESEIQEHLSQGYTPELEPLNVRFDARPSKFKGRLNQLMAGAVDTGKGAGGVVSRSGSALIRRADDARGTIGGVVVKTRDRATDVGGSIARHTYPLLVGFTEFAGTTAESLADNSSLRRIAQNFKLEQWLDVTDRIDIEKAQQHVLSLKQEYPSEDSRQLARRLMMQKALYAGGLGLATKLYPASVLPLLAVDVAGMALMQAELVYQIAAAYDLDLEDSARKGELLAVFGCVLGTSRAVKAGLTILELAPVAGAVIGASSNAVMIYALGYAASRFYEEKLHLQISQDSIELVKQENALFLQGATNQEAIADQVLVHVLLAGHPEETPEKLLSLIETANLSPASRHAIAQNIVTPTSLDALLNQLQPDFAVYLLGQCHQFAQMDGILTDGEKEILHKIAQHFEIDFEIGD